MSQLSAMVKVASLRHGGTAHVVVEGDDAHLPRIVDSHTPAVTARVLQWGAGRRLVHGSTWTRPSDRLRSAIVPTSGRRRGWGSSR